MRHYITMIKPAIWLGALLLASCSAAPDESAKTAVTTLKPMAAPDIRAFLPGHYIDEGPYACLGGPILVLADGTFDTSTDWSGRASGDYVITDGRIAFDNRGAPEHFTTTILLYRDQNGAAWYRHEGDTNDPKPARLKPADPGIFKRLCGLPEG